MGFFSHNFSYCSESSYFWVQMEFKIWILDYATEVFLWLQDKNACEKTKNTALVKTTEKETD